MPAYPDIRLLSPSSSSIRSSWLYFATRSLLARCTRLNLAGVQSNCQVCNGSICCFTRTVRRNCSITCLVCHLDGFQCFGNATNLIQLNQNGVATAQRNALGQAVRYWLQTGHPQRAVPYRPVPWSASASLPSLLHPVHPQWR